MALYGPCSVANVCTTLTQFMNDLSYAAMHVLGFIYNLYLQMSQAARKHID